MSQVETQDKTFQKVLALCDVTKDMLLALQAPHVKNKQELLDIVTPVVQSVDNAVKVVMETFIEHIGDGQKLDKQRSYKVDMAMKGVYDALRAMRDRGEEIVQSMHQEPQNG